MTHVEIEMPERVRLRGWQPIETAPLNELIFIRGWDNCGGGSPSGPYKYHKTIIGEWDGFTASDIQHPGCDCIRARTLDEATHWYPLDWPQA